MSIESVYAVLPAAGTGARMGADIPKQLMPYRGSTVLGTSIRKFASHKMVDAVVIVSPEDGSLDEIYNKIAEEIASESGCADCRIIITRGSDTRGRSVHAGLRAALEDALAEGMDPGNVVVMIHDAARPGVTNEIIDANISSMELCEGVCTALPSVDSVRLIQINSAFPLKESTTYPIMMSNVVRRDLVYMVQTPQTFFLSDILSAYEKADASGYAGTDDASVAEFAGMKVGIVPGAACNAKITYQEDISMTTRVGSGYDVHRLVPGRDLILCGTPVPYERGLLGHSDADVATHALMDALLGAAGLGDIGRHFPDNDEKYRGADSIGLLREVRKMLGDVTVNNVDITIIAEAPKLAPYIDRMKENISETLGIPSSAVNIKATTEEGLGFTGRGEGIAAMAVCSIEGRFI